MRDLGTEMFDVLTDHRARKLLESLEQVSPATRALVSNAGADEALLDALEALEKDPTSAHQLHVIVRAKAIHLVRMRGNREKAV
jgi:hypothetical protein